jgi:hypothetical protein
VNEQINMKMSVDDVFDVFIGKDERCGDAPDADNDKNIDED